MARKGENIRKRKDGRWEGRIITGHDSTGKAVYKSLYANSYLAVKQKVKEYVPENTPKVNETYTVSECAEKWLSAVKLRCKTSTYSKYDGICRNHVIPAVGDCKLEEVRIEQIEGIIDESTGLSAKTRGDILCVIKMLFKFSKSNGMSAVDLSGLSVRQLSTPIRVLTANEQQVLINYLFINTDLIKLGIYLSLCTGIRIGELCALKRNNISFEENILKVTATMQRVQADEGGKKTKVILTEPKSRSSIRDIPLPEFLTDLLKEYYSALPKDAYLLTGKADRYIEPRLLEYKFRKYTKDCGLSDVKFHSLRHTFATRCVENGMDIKSLSEILGHENVNITLNRYVHSSMELKRQGMEKLRGIF